MGFWDKVNTELKKAAQEGWEAVKGSARSGKLRLRKHTLNKKAEKRFAEIGGIVYDMAEPPWENPLSRPAVLKLIEEIKRIEAEIAEIENEVEVAAGEGSKAEGAGGAGGGEGAGGKGTENKKKKKSKE
ncbi:MAG: hypothetical protein ACE5EI_08070 [Thermodesulfobacteriota bacterium]